jgi:hypothetical protein
MKLSVRCVNGPYAGQTFLITNPKNFHYKPEFGAWWIGPLTWINYGTDKHCYQLVSNGWNRDWRLVYRDTF